MTGALLERMPGIHRYTQHQWPNRPAWHYRGSVFDSYRCETTERRELLRVVVTVGISDVDFGRLLQAAANALPSSVDVLWQVGNNDPAGIRGDVRAFVAHAELGHAMEKADLVICHAGVGSVLTAFGAGHCPIVVPRRLARVSTSTIIRRSWPDRLPHGALPSPSRPTSSTRTCWLLPPHGRGSGRRPPTYVLEAPTGRRRGTDRIEPSAGHAAA